MFKKLTVLIAAILMMYGFSAQAGGHTEAYKKCMRTQSSDKELTKCQENEYQHYVQKVFPERIKTIKEEAYFAPMLSKYSLEEQYQLWEQMTKIFCQYYVKAKENQGYSDAFNMSSCLLERAESYEEWLSSIIINAQSDIKG